MHNTGQDGQDAHCGYDKPARVIYWIAAGNASAMEEAEWYVTKVPRDQSCSLRNPVDARTGGAGVRDGDHRCHLHFGGDSYNDKGCHCNCCVKFTREMHEAWKSPSDDDDEDADDGADDLQRG